MSLEISLSRNDLEEFNLASLQLFARKKNIIQYQYLDKESLIRQLLDEESDDESDEEAQVEFLKNLRLSIHKKHQASGYKMCTPELKRKIQKEHGWTN